jgi:hypothetical protein
LYFIIRIASKTKIGIEWSCLEQIKKTEEKENKEWYARLAKDDFGYIAIYRDAIDSLQQLTHELWKIVMNDKSHSLIRLQLLRKFIT